MGYRPRAGARSSANAISKGPPKEIVVNNSYKGTEATSEERLFGKACRILTLSGIADNNEVNWNLLESKHPYAPIPSPPTSVPSQSSVDLLPSDVNILAVLLPFPEDTSCGPSDLRSTSAVNTA